MEQIREQALPPARQMLAAVVLVMGCVTLWQKWVNPADDGSLPVASLSLDGSHLRGSHDSTVGLMVFADFECPACGRLAREVIPSITRRYVDSGKVLLAFSDLPLESIHPSALRRAAIAECASRQGRFWEVHDRLFQDPASPSIETESTLDLDQEQLEDCLGADAVTTIRRRQSWARDLGIRSTPTLLVGSIAGGQLEVAEAVIGVRPSADIAAILDRLLDQPRTPR